MYVTPKRNILQKALNRLGLPLAMKPFPVAFESSMPERGTSAKTVFSAVYERNYWGDTESASGSGSTLQRTADYRAALIELLRKRKFGSFFDAPCGDLNWMPAVLEQVNIKYIGGDIVAPVIEEVRAKYPDLDIRLFDICVDKFPDVDVWHCRDTLFHLSFYEIWRAFERVAASRTSYALITTHRARMLTNLDITTGGFRLLDLERAPFGLPKADVYLDDSGPGEFRRAVGLWPVNAISKALADRR